MRGLRFGAAALAVVVALSGCALGKPDPNAPVRSVAVAWENRTNRVYTITFAHNGDVVATGQMDPCTAAGMETDILEPFDVGVLEGGGPGDTPTGVKVADSSAWREAGERKVVIVIDEAGSATVEMREHVLLATGICPGDG